MPRSDYDAEPLLPEHLWWKLALLNDAIPPIGYLLDHGLDWRVISRHVRMMVLTQVRFSAPRTFDPGGRTDAVVIETLDETGTAPNDFVAWPIGKPEKAASMFGRADFVGARAFWDPATYAFDSPLQVHRTVFDWLKSGCDGIAIVHPERAARILLDAPGRLAAQDAPHAKTLAEIMRSAVDLSRIVLPIKEVA